MEKGNVSLRFVSSNEYDEYDVFQHVLALSFLSNNHRVKNTSYRHNDS